VPVVSGSSSGIGLGIARALGGAGAHLVLNGFGDTQ
jgi:3-hydroxybutyrate dehydrogenase